MSVLSDAEPVRRPQLRWWRRQRLRCSSSSHCGRPDDAGTVAAATATVVVVCRQRHPRTLLSGVLWSIFLFLRHLQCVLRIPAGSRNLKGSRGRERKCTRGVAMHFGARFSTINSGILLNYLYLLNSRSVWGQMLVDVKFHLAKRANSSSVI